MSLADINPKLLTPTGNGYETLRDAITNGVKKITKRDALFLVNKQMEGISETRGNLYIYMFYFACNPAGKKTPYSPTWFNGLRVNDIGAGGGDNESTPWCACYTSFALNWAGISPHGHYGSNNQASTHNLTQNGDFLTAKTGDLIQYGSSGAGHTCFLLKEGTNNPNNYKTTKRNGLDLPFFQFGGNQGDSVNITAPSRPKLNGFYSNSEYEKEINAFDMLSVLAYFVDANLKTPQERIKEINARLDKTVTIGTALEAQVSFTITIKNFLSDITYKGSGYTLSNDPNTQCFKDRFKELLVFEQSLIDSNLPLTTNISGKAGPAGGIV